MSTQQKKIYILSGVAIVVFLSWFFLLIHPTQNLLHEKDDLIYQERIRGEIVTQREKNVQATQREYEQLRSSSETFTSYFVSEKNVLSFIAALEKLAQESSATQEIVNLVAPTGSSRATSFQIQLHGTTQGILEYLSDLETLHYYVAVNRMTFTSTDSAQTSASLNVTLNVTIHWL